MFQSPAGDSLSCDVGGAGGFGRIANAFQSPAGDSLSCDLVACGGTGRTGFRFNRPQAIRCLATGIKGDLPAPRRVSIARRRFVVLRRHPPQCWPRCTRFQSPAGDSLSCDGERHIGSKTASVSIARRRFVVLRQGGVLEIVDPNLGFNRPQAIRCLATGVKATVWLGSLKVSIARRRFVVLRLPYRAFCRIGLCLVSIARRRFVVLRPPSRFPQGRMSASFQSPAGDSLSCDAWRWTNQP